TRTFSKSHSLAGMRVGFAVGPEPVIDLLYRVKDSYNLNVAAQVTGLAAWLDDAWTQDKVARIVASREKTSARLRELGFDVPASAGNFLFARHPDAPELFRRLR